MTMRKYLNKQQVEKMFRTDLESANLNENEITKEVYWFQLLNCLYKNGSIAKKNCTDWRYNSIC